MSDIVERLQGSRTPQGGLWPYPNLHDEAADEITRLREENARLLGLLREAHVKMDANNLWSNLRNRVAAAIREGGKDEN
jgi:hypothetical protein